MASNLLPNTGPPDPDEPVVDTFLSDLARTTTSAFQFFEMFDVNGAIANEGLEEVMDDARDKEMEELERFFALQSSFNRELISFMGSNFNLKEYFGREAWNLSLPYHPIPIEAMQVFHDALVDASTLTHRVVNAAKDLSREYHFFRETAVHHEQERERLLATAPEGRPKKMVIMMHYQMGLRVPEQC